MVVMVMAVAMVIGIRRRGGGERAQGHDRQNGKQYRFHLIDPYE